MIIPVVTRFNTLYAEGTNKTSLLQPSNNSFVLNTDEKYNGEGLNILNHLLAIFGNPI
jgi:hypothetical protein